MSKYPTNLSVGLVDEVNLWVGVAWGLYGSCCVSLDLSCVLVQLIPPQLLAVQLQPI